MKLFSKIVLLMLCLVMIMSACVACGNKDGKLEYVYDKENKGYIVAGLGDYALTDVVIPQTYKGKAVISIADGAFSNEKGKSITSIVIPSSVKSVGARAFFNCVSLTSLTIENGVEKIGDKAFAGCMGLTSVTIPASVVKVGGYIFGGCKNLTEINYAWETLPEGWSEDWETESPVEQPSTPSDTPGSLPWDEL